TSLTWNHFGCPPPLCEGRKETITCGVSRGLSGRKRIGVRRWMGEKPEISGKTAGNNPSAAPPPSSCPVPKSFPDCREGPTAASGPHPEAQGSINTSRRNGI
ncbi:hypothetical protein KUCAC02_037061, partial [Chaenocephalus aceratus]